MVKEVQNATWDLPTFKVKVLDGDIELSLSSIGVRLLDFRCRKSNQRFEQSHIHITSRIR